MTTALISTVATPDGPFTVLVDEHGRVLSSGWTASEDEIVERIRRADRPEHVRSSAGSESERARAAVDAYYAGDVTAIDTVEVVQFGTPRQLAGWSGLRAIAPGSPLSYAEFATALGSPSAVRAAASICARNAPALFVPCHRVLRTDGSLGGFAWGVDVKQSLLAREAGQQR